MTNYIVVRAKDNKCLDGADTFEDATAIAKEYAAKDTPCYAFTRSVGYKPTSRVVAID